MQQTFVERRQSPRHRVFKGGLIAFRGQSLTCTVRNLSDGGANLDVDSTAAVPVTFTLVLESDKTIRRCEIKWRADRRVGVAFA